MDLLESHLDSEQVKVLQGIRRCGKSSLLEMLRTRLLERGIPERNIYRKRFDEFGLPLAFTAEQLISELQHMLSQSDDSKMRYVFLDEIQEVHDWPKVVRGLHTLDNVDVYITGSNAHLLSTDLATALAGRTVTIDVHPLSFKEYLAFTRALFETRANLSHDELFADYVRFGGMPTLFALREFSEDGIARELESVYNTVILRDVAQHLQIRDIPLLNRLVTYLFSTSGNLFSARKIVGALMSGGRKTSVETIETYIDGLTRAFILFATVQFGLQGKDLLNPLRKFYVEDSGLRNIASGFSSQNYGFQLENIVANELRRRGYDVRVGSLRRGEVDFIAQQFDKRIYIQVTETMLDDTTRARELAPLQSLADSFPKIVLTLDRFHLGMTSDGIEIRNIVDWLLDS
ncbi:ATP-binding protein [Bifidobacterium pseudolongum]|nr:ATP-binding protein [Bifidobacterium pseudolongum]